MNVKDQVLDDVAGLVCRYAQGWPWKQVQSRAGNQAWNQVWDQAWSRVWSQLSEDLE